MASCKTIVTVVTVVTDRRNAKGAMTMNFEMMQVSIQQEKAEKYALLMPQLKPANKKSSPQENLTEGNLQERVSKNEQHKKAAAERRPEKSERDQGCFGNPVESISTGGRSSSVERYSMTLP